jgi:phosphoribosyl-AMP cyclohydrolase
VRPAGGGGEDAAGLLARVRYDDRGLVPCVVQSADSGEVLMVAWANAEALALTVSTGEAHFFSRSRRELWHKGATSGNVQRVVSLHLDCDADTVLLRVDPAGPACHTGAVSCFRDEANGGCTWRAGSHRQD